MFFHQLPWLFSRITSRVSPRFLRRWVRDGDPLDADLADLSALDAESARHAAGPKN